MLPCGPYVSPKPVHLSEAVLGACYLAAPTHNISKSAAIAENLVAFVNIANAAKIINSPSSLLLAVPSLSFSNAVHFLPHHPN